MSFAERLRTTRKERGYSQEQLAERLDVSRQCVTKWEAGISYPEIKTLLELAAVLDRDLDWLLYQCIGNKEMHFGRASGWGLCQNRCRRTEVIRKDSH